MSNHGKSSFLCVLVGIMLTASLTAQPGVLRFEDGQMILTLDRSWSDEQLMQAVRKYDLDSAWVFNAMRNDQLDETGTWKLIKVTEQSKVFISSFSPQSTSQFDHSTHVILWPEDVKHNFFDGPGYVDQSQVRYGVNQFKGTPPQQTRTTITFSVNAFPDARELSITGSFNNWNTTGLPLQKKGNAWVAELELAPGKYLYKFLVDGYWESDPFNKLREEDGYGRYNSVLYKYNHTFRLEGFLDAKNVYLAGSFCDWNERELKLKRTETGWAISLYIREGTHTYKFIVDGQWMNDPHNPHVLPDGHGNNNSLFALGDTTFFELSGHQGASEVVLSGNFNGWNERELRMHKSVSGWQLPYVLPPGNYEYKFLIDGQWILDPSNPFKIRHGDILNSFKAVEPNRTFVLPGFDQAKEVLVTGNFTGWSEDNNRMVRTKKGWEFPLHLQPGKYQYRFKIDGKWISDPHNPLIEDNGLGEENSVLWVYPGESNKNL